MLATQLQQVHDIYKGSNEAISNSMSVIEQRKSVSCFNMEYWKEYLHLSIILVTSKDWISCINKIWFL